MSGKYTIIMEQLVAALKAKNLRSEEIKNQIIQANGSIQSIQALQGKLNLALYKTCYEQDRRAQINI